MNSVALYRVEYCAETHTTGEGDGRIVHTLDSWRLLGPSDELVMQSFGTDGQTRLEILAAQLNAENPLQLLDLSGVQSDVQQTLRDMEALLESVGDRKGTR